MPFFAEKMYQNLRLGDMKESVHLSEWPKSEGQTDLDLEEKMKEVRDIVALALAERSEKAIRIRQPLASLKINPSASLKAGNQKAKIKNNDELLKLIKDEVNVEEIIFDGKIKKEIELDTNITEELKEKGNTREIIRCVQDMRKEAGLKPQDEILVYLEGSEELNKILDKSKQFILKEVKAKSYSSEKELSGTYLQKEILVDGQKLLIKIYPIK